VALRIRRAPMPFEAALQHHSWAPTS
jgi:hypothetical protein